MTNVEIRFLEIVPTRLSDLVKELKELNTSIKKITEILENETNAKEE